MLAFLFFSQLGNAQSGDNSLFSRFGLGDLVDENFMYLRSMGGLGASFNDPYQINIVNPASYAMLKAAAFEFGVYGKYANFTDGTNSSSLWSGNLEYFSLAFPLTNPLNELLERERSKFHLGMNFTLIPHSTVSYNITSEEFQEGIGNFARNFSGSGGSYKFYWGNAINYKNISFGLNLGYLFGNIDYSRNVRFDDLDFVFNNSFQNEYSLKGFLWNAGLQYNKVLNQKQYDEDRNVSLKRISFGLHGHTNNGFSSESNILEQVIQTTTSIADTSVNSMLDVPGDGTLPAEFGIGATYWNGQKWSLGVNYSFVNWTAYRNTAAENDELLNSSKISIGGFIRPDHKSYSSYFKRVYYRFGAFYNTEPISIQEERIKKYGVTFGMGLPFIYQRKISHANLGLEIGSRGQGAILSERYLRITGSFTFNDDEWFIKRKYN